MNKIFFALLLLLLFAFRFPDDCGGTYRWDNKILIDTAGLKLFTKPATAAIIQELVTIPKPPQNQLGKNRSEPEKRKVTVTAFLIGLGEEADHDYHLILTSLDFKDSLIAEIPDPSCTKLAHFPGLKNNYNVARTFIIQNVEQSPGAIHYLNQAVKITITGVLFFDKKAHGNGHSRNDIEIHPVLKISKSG